VTKPPAGLFVFTFSRNKLRWRPMAQGFRCGACPLRRRLRVFIEHINHLVVDRRADVDRDECPVGTAL
jgi:hypothetical protein